MTSVHLRLPVLLAAMLCGAIGVNAQGVAKHAICHVPPGNPAKARTLMLPEPAIQAHLDHGDTLGACGGVAPNAGAPVIEEGTSVDRVGPTAGADRGKQTAAREGGAGTEKAAETAGQAAAGKGQPGRGPKGGPQAPRGKPKP